jgi:hypothetical protein
LREHRLREAKEGQGEVDKAVLVLLDVGLAVDDLRRPGKRGSATHRRERGPLTTHLVELEDGQAADDRGRRDERGDNLAGNLFRLVLVGRGDAVVEGAQVRGRVDEGDVVVCVVILLEIDRRQAVAGERGRRGQGLDNLLGVGRLCKEEESQVPSAKANTRDRRSGDEPSSSLATGSASLTWTLTPCLGTKAGTSTEASTFLKTDGLLSPLRP